jgi:hypothetical protein
LTISIFTAQNDTVKNIKRYAHYWSVYELHGDNVTIHKSTLYCL